jgi:cysteine synthase
MLAKAKKELLLGVRQWPLSIERVPDTILPEALLNERLEIHMVAGSSLPHGNTKAITVLGLLSGHQSFEGVDTLVEGTSGNTGKVVSAVAFRFGIPKVVLIMESDVPNGKRFPGIAHGAKIMPPEDGLTTIQTARAWGKRPGWLNLDQYSNPNGLLLHRDFIGPKIVSTLIERPTLFAAPIGTGGSLGGVREYLIRRGCCEFIGVLLDEDEELPGMRDEPGMKEVELPWRTYADRIVKVEARESYYASLCLIRATGLSLGPTAGAAFIGLLKRLLDCKAAGALDSVRNRAGKIIAVVLGPDGYEVYGDRYDARVHRRHSKPGMLPLPWKFLNQKHRSFSA